VQYLIPVFEEEFEKRLNKMPCAQLARNRIEKLDASPWAKRPESVGNF